MTWRQFADSFDAVWGASSFKGAYGETLIVPDANMHLENNIGWLEVSPTDLPPHLSTWIFHWLFRWISIDFPGRKLPRFACRSRMPVSRASAAAGCLHTK